MLQHNGWLAELSSRKLHYSALHCKLKWTVAEHSSFVQHCAKRARQGFIPENIFLQSPCNQMKPDALSLHDNVWWAWHFFPGKSNFAFPMQFNARNILLWNGKHDAGRAGLSSWKRESHPFFPPTLLPCCHTADTSLCLATPVCRPGHLIFNEEILAVYSLHLALYV